MENEKTSIFGCHGRMAIRVVIEPQKLEKGGCIERLVVFTENMDTSFM
jgi:hypothetical protein